TSKHADLLSAGVRAVLGPTARVLVRTGEGPPDSPATRPPGPGARGSASAPAAATGSPENTTPNGPSPGGRRRAKSLDPGPDQARLDEIDMPTSPFPDRYTFDAFVPGASNKFAHAAAMAVAESPPSKVYNPLFIYGGVGLGKTHLLYAVDQHMTRLNPALRCKYVTSETFVTEFIKAVRERQGYQFQ